MRLLRGERIQLYCPGVRDSRSGGRWLTGYVESPALRCAAHTHSRSTWPRMSYRSVTYLRLVFYLYTQRRGGPRWDPTVRRPVRAHADHTRTGISLTHGEAPPTPNGTVRESYGIVAAALSPGLSPPPPPPPTLPPLQYTLYQLHELFQSCQQLFQSSLYHQLTNYVCSTSGSAGAASRRNSVPRTTLAPPPTPPPLLYTFMSCSRAASSYYNHHYIINSPTMCEVLAAVQVLRSGEIVYHVSH